MGRIIRTCRCGNTYVHEELESPECPNCGRIGEVEDRRLHRCENCAIVEKCPPERKEGVAKYGVCMHYKRPEPVRY